MAYDNYSFIWNGTEEEIGHQISRLDNIVGSVGGRTLRWKDKTIQDRVCNYVGKPQQFGFRKNEKLKHNNIANKYTLAKLTDRQLAEVQAEFGKEFPVETTVETIDAIVVNLFEFMSLPSDVMESVKRRFQVFGNQEEMMAYVAAQTPEGAEYKTKDSYDQIHRVSREERYNVGQVTRFVIYQTEQVVLNPWVVLNEQGLDEAGIKITQEITGEDTAMLKISESKEIDRYNNSLAIYRKTKRPGEFDNQILHDAYNAREAADRALKEVRARLGKVKSKMTAYMKRNGGIEFDLEPYSVK